MDEPIESADRFRLLADNIPGVVYLCRDDPRYTMLYLNDEVERLTGWPKEDFLADRISFVDLYHPDDAPEIAPAVEIARGKKRSFRLVYRLRHRSGEWRWVEEHGVAIERPDGSALLEGFLADVTEKRIAEERLRESEARYRAMFEENRAIKLLIDPADGRIVDANPAACEFYGWPRERLRAMNIREINTLPEPEVVRDLQRAAQERQTEFRFRHRTARGETRDVQVFTGPLTIDGRVTLFSIIHDVTEQRRAEEESRRLAEQVGHTQKLESLTVLAGGVAHDFNNLLVGILGTAGLALLEIADVEVAPAQRPRLEALRRHLDEIEKVAERAAELAREMLAYSGRGHFVVQPFLLSELVAEMVPLLRSSISHQAGLDLRAAPNGTAIEGDATQVRQVVLNLVTNASAALGDGGGAIVLATGRATLGVAELHGLLLGHDLPAGDYVWLEVQDDGCGMDEATQARIFEPFFTTRKAGRGLGLAAVLGIVRGHRGAIRIESRPGHGTGFRIFFPASDKAPLPLRDEPPPPRPFEGRGRVLVVDDEEIVRYLAARVLERAGFEVVLAEDGRRALELFTPEPAAFQAVLLDLTMPHLGGEEVLAELRRIRPGVPVLLSSGFSEQEALRRLSGQSIGFIQKPYRPAELVARIREVMQG